MLVKEFLLLVIISNIIALPLAYLNSNGFLRMLYANRTDTGAGIFILTAAITLLTAVVAVIYQTMKAARANPVDVLKYE